MPISFSTKAETLERLENVLSTATILPQIRFTLTDWQAKKGAIINELTKLNWFDKNVIVRSSGINEDSDAASLAGHFVSIQNLMGKKAFSEAVENVILGFGGDTHIDNQIFVQPQLENVKESGVAFSRDPNSASHYYIVNYDDDSGRTDTITSGKAGNIKTYYQFKGPGSVDLNLSENLRGVINLLDELEKLLDCDHLDIEFAYNDAGKLYLFQVRVLNLPDGGGISLQNQAITLNQISNKIEILNKPHPYLYGSKTVFGIMPDWNPAEIIGVRPRPLALSLYQDLVTDNIWAYQRDNYGYKNLRSFPLLNSFAGLPYIDVRISFNSFIPEDVDCDLADRLVNFYLDRLIETPTNHDKVEFEIIHSCYFLDLPKKLGLLKDKGFSDEDCLALENSLRNLTNRIIHPKTGLWRADREKISELENRQLGLTNSDLDPLSKIYWLLEDCKRYGTLPFAGLARAGFVSIQMLQSLVRTGILSQSDYEIFMGSLNSIGSSLAQDFNLLNKNEFLRKYGHLRPGTYNVLSPRYDEKPDLYFQWDQKTSQDTSENKLPFSLSSRQYDELQAELATHKLDLDANDLFTYLRESIEGREFAKFVFSKSLSDALSMFENYAKEFGFSREDISYAEISIVKELYAGSADPKTVIERSIEKGRKNYNITKHLILPPLITNLPDVFAFEMPINEPNFITLMSATGNIVFEKAPRGKLAGNILMIPSADPGYDWIFSHDIAGFVTIYGGANSHMAIRSAELSIPAVIGAGETLYNIWSQAQTIRLDCANKQVEVIR
jgi:glutamine kinase